MRYLVAALLLVGVAERTTAQEPPKFRNLDEGISYLEERVVGRQVPMTDRQTLLALLEILNKADAVLAQGSEQDPVTPVAGRPVGGPVRMVAVPRTVLVPSRGWGRRCHAVTVCECVYVQVPDGRIPSCPPTQKYGGDFSKLRLNAVQLNQRLLQPIASDAELTELVRQVYALAVMAREPFTPGRTRN